MTLSSKRAEYVSATALIISIIFFIITFLLGRWSGYFSVFALSFVLGCAGLIWLVLVIQFHQRALAEQEKLDISGLASRGRTGGIFETGQGSDLLFAVAQRRLALLEKWFLPAFSIIIGLYQAGVGFYLVNIHTYQLKPVHREPLVCAIALIALFFVTFLISRYAAGMSSEDNWRPLKAGAGIFAATAILSFVLAVALAFAYFDILPIVITVINWAVPILLIFLGIETELHVIFDIYRPRLPGQYSRAAFESRILSLLSETGGILHTAATAIDYQFGFKVSQTWFYKLLEQAIVPLILFAAACLYLLSSVVVIGPQEEAIVERLGRPIKGINGVKIFQPGLTFKWPWPIDKAYIYPTRKITELSIGYKPKIDPKTNLPERSAKLWGTPHYQEEYKLLVASRPKGESFQAAAEPNAEAVPLSLVIAAVPVQYEVNNLYNYLYNYGEEEGQGTGRGYTAQKMLEAICYQELTDYASAATIEVDTEAELQHSLLGAGRIEAQNILRERIQQAADRAGLGVKIDLVGLQGIHPPPDVAADYQKVVGAVQIKKALILRAQTDRNKIFSTQAGSVGKFEVLYRLASQYLLAESQNEQEKVTQLTEQLDKAFAQVSGDLFAVLRRAKSYAFERATLARATGQQYGGRLKAYEAAPQIYMLEQKLKAFEEALANVRKYVIIADPNEYQIYQVDITEKLIPGLTDITGFQESNPK